MTGWTDKHLTTDQSTLFIYWALTLYGYGACGEVASSPRTWLP